MRFLKFFSLFFLGIVLLVSCSTEMRLAGNLQRKKDQIHILCSFPEHIFLSNSKVPIPDGLSANEETIFLDSLFYNSDYVQYIDDTIFLRKFKTYTKKYFEDMGFSYHEVNDLNNFLTSDGMLYLVKFKQLELEERWFPYHQEEQFDSTIYEEDIWINGISLNAWMDVSKVNDTVEVQRALYEESILSDRVTGMFFQNQWSGEVQYQYQLDTLQLNEVGELQTQSAIDLGTYLVNYIINKEIRDRLNYLEGVKPRSWWFFSSKSGRFLPEPIR
jgi:hypothetical protein